MDTLQRTTTTTTTTIDPTTTTDPTTLRQRLHLRVLAIAWGLHHHTRHGPVRSERAASLVEYALLVALIAVVMVGAVTLLGDTATGSLDRSGSSILTATS